MFGLGAPELIIIAIITLMPIFCIIIGTIMLSRYLSKKDYQRAALIEKGIDLTKLEKNPNERQNGLKIGMFLVAVSIGLLTAYILTRLLYIPDVVIYFSMIFLFGGFSLILYYILSVKNLIK